MNPFTAIYKIFEIDIVGLKLEKGQAVAIEVKRQKKNFKPELFKAKVEHLRNKVLPKYEIKMKCLSLEDMWENAIMLHKRT